jgi:hypothetical protein
MMNHVGENRKKVRRIVMEAVVTVTVEWPQGIQFNEETCKHIAASGMPQHWDRDVGAGRIVWASAFSECSTDEVDIIENVEIK